MRTHQFATTILSAVLAVGNVGAAEDLQADAPASERNPEIRSWMQKFAEGTTVRRGTAADGPAAKMIPQPVFHYSDVEREIPDATLWVWTQDGRPVAFQKVEVNAHGGGKLWTIAFASLSADLLRVEWSAQGVRRTYESTAPGVSFKPIPRAAPPTANNRLRVTQMKQLANRFEGRLVTGSGTAEIRIIPTPIFEYTDPATEQPIGAIFGITATGTNPDILLLIEARADPRSGDLRWEYAAAQLTTSGVVLKRDGAIAWEKSSVSLSEGVQPSWVFYFLSRRLDFEP